MSAKHRVYCKARNKSEFFFPTNGFFLICKSRGDESIGGVVEITKARRLRPQACGK